MEMRKIIICTVFCAPVSTFPDYKAKDTEKSRGKLMQEYFSDEELKTGDLINIRLYANFKEIFWLFQKNC